MKLVAANLRPFDPGEAPRRRACTVRSVPEPRHDGIIATHQTTAKTAQAGEDDILDPSKRARRSHSQWRG
jgi:hypothetical protein